MLQRVFVADLVPVARRRGRPVAAVPTGLRIGIVCPYSFDVPGGVQFHVRDLAEHLIGAGHAVSVLAPADDDTPLPPVRRGRRGAPCR